MTIHILSVFAHLKICLLHTYLSAGCYINVPELSDFDFLFVFSLILPQDSFSFNSVILPRYILLFVDLYVFLEHVVPLLEVKVNIF